MKNIMQGMRRIQGFLDINLIKAGVKVNLSEILVI